jgi:hydrogenase expression/formation protein HypC
MCLGIPGRIVEIVDAANSLAKVDVNGVQRTISIRLLEGDPENGGVRPQDWVLVHVGFAMAKIDEAEAMLTLAAMEKLGEAYRAEIEAFDTSAIR